MLNKISSNRRNFMFISKKVIPLNWKIKLTHLENIIYFKFNAYYVKLKYNLNSLRQALIDNDLLAIKESFFCLSIPWMIKICKTLIRFILDIFEGNWIHFVKSNNYAQEHLKRTRTNLSYHVLALEFSKNDNSGSIVL